MKNTLQTTIIALELACIVSLVVLSGYGVSSLGTVGFIKQMSSAVGMTAGVPENEFNKLAQELKQKDTAITEREKALAERETIILREQKINNARLSALILVIGLVLFSLILLNFYLDAKRKRGGAGYVVNLENKK
ncbi:MAG: hypothetical protein WC878_07150 [Candidatus Paceibacterota bacterium]|jgi:hypothetical protein